MSPNRQEDSHSAKRIGLALVVGLLLLAPQLASADSFVLLMDRGAAKKKIMADLSAQLKEAGHKSMVTGASLEDSALMLGCTPTEGACIDMVIETAGVDGAIILPRRGAALVVRRRGSSNRAKVAGGTKRAYRAALTKALGLSAPQVAVVETKPDPKDSKPDNTNKNKQHTLKMDPVPEPEPEAAPEVAEVTDPEPPPSGADLSSGTQAEGSGFDMGQVKTRTWIILGSGVASSAAGLVLFQLAAGKQDKVDNHPVDTAEDLQALRDLESSGASYATAGNFLFIAGGVATLAGAGLMVFDARSAREERLSVVPTATSSSMGVALRWDGL